MANPFESDDAEYFVLVNGERQYCIWPASQEIPAGWTSTGPKRQRAESVMWIDRNWTDMRPKNLTETPSSALSSPDFSDDLLKS